MWIVWPPRVLPNRSSTASMLRGCAELLRSEEDLNVKSVYTYVQSQTQQCHSMISSVPDEMLQYSLCLLLRTLTWALPPLQITSQALGYLVRLNACWMAGNGWAAVAQTSGLALLFYWAKSICELPTAAFGWFLLPELAHLTFMYLNIALQSAV